MEMLGTKRRILLLSLIIALILAVFTAVSYFSQSNSSTVLEETPQPTEPPETPNNPELVVPEAPLGTLTLFGAMAAGWAAFMLKKRAGHK